MPVSMGEGLAQPVEQQHAPQCEREWSEAEPTCMCGFAMERGAAELVLWYHPPGTFLIRICQEPGSFAVSCRVSPHPEDSAPGEPSAGVPACLSPARV